MDRSERCVTAVIMARRPVPGQIKTRLTNDGWCDEDEAAAIGRAMMRCTVDRLKQVFGQSNVLLAMTPDVPESVDGFGDVRMIAQGTGDLGARIGRVWEHLGAPSRTVFFGIDSPDVPAEEVRRILEFFENEDADAAIWIGPAADGGFWAIGGRQFVPEIFANIDWGTDVVYDQVCAASRIAGLKVVPGRSWFDIDHGRDVEALLERLDEPRESDEALAKLRRELTAIIAKHTTGDRRS